MKAIQTTKKHIHSLAKRKKSSHKRDNGSVLVIAGSKQFHGAEILAAKAASFFADLVFVLTEKENVPIAKQATPVIIVSELTQSSIKKFIARSDSVLIGPGLTLNSKNKKLINSTVKNFPNKKFILDATALRLIEPKNLHKNCLVTPHAGEFRSLFKAEPTQSNVLANAKKFHCSILLKGPVDFISNGAKLYRNETGNPLLTAGGTGDVLAGTAAAFASKNALFESALAAAFLTGFAGDRIAKSKAGLNAEMLLEELPKAMKGIE